MNIVKRNNVKIVGQGQKTLMLAPGFGCHQGMWKHFTDNLSGEFRMILFDHVGSGGSDIAAYDRDKYDSLDGYADDVIEILKTLEIPLVTFVGHSVSAMIGALAAIKEPSLFSELVLLGPSPCYLNDGDYQGGFDRQSLQKLLDDLDSNFLEWSRAMAPVIMGRPDKPELGIDLAENFCRNRPEVAKHFARVTFLSDLRQEMSQVKVRTLILQCSDDAIAPESVGRYLHRVLPRSELILLSAKGHCPHLSEPQETIEAMKSFLKKAG